MKRSVVALAVVVLACGHGGTVPQQTDGGVTGLRTCLNDQGLPLGSLATADNLAIFRPGIGEPRPGFPPLTTTYPGGSTARRVLFYKGALHVHAGTTLSYWNGSAWVSYVGTFTSPDSNRPIPAFVANGNLYVATNNGMRVIDTLGGTPYYAGVPRALDAKATGSSGHAGGSFLHANSARAVRAVWGRKDSQGRVTYGTPSGRLVLTGLDVWRFDMTISITSGVGTATVTNPPHDLAPGDVVYLTRLTDTFITEGYYTVATVPDTTHFTFLTSQANGSTTGTVRSYYGTGDVKVRVPVSADITTSHFLQLYATPESPGAAVDPGDTSYQVYEYVPNNVDLSNGYVEIWLTSPTGIGGQLGYWNIDGQYNDQPPVSPAWTTFRQRAWSLNSTGRQQILLSLLSVEQWAGPAAGLDYNLGVYITKGGPHAATPTARFYRALNADIAGSQFTVTINPLSVAASIASTARSLVAAINSDASASWVACYVSGPDDPPGMIVIEAKELTTPQFSVWSSNTNAAEWAPRLPSSFTTVTFGDQVRAANVTTIHTQAAHGLSVGDVVSVYPIFLPADPNFPAGQFTVATVPDATHFTYSDPGTNATCSAPYALDAHAGFGLTAPANIGPGNLMYSKAQPTPLGAMPADNESIVDDNGSEGMAIVPTRNSLIVFTRDRGVYRVREGVDAPVIEAIDRKLTLLAPETAQQFGDNVLALTNRGVVEITDEGVRVPSVSADIANLLPTTPSSNLERHAWAGVWDTGTALLYLLFCEFNDQLHPTVPTAAYVYARPQGVAGDGAGGHWTRWLIPATAGAQEPGTNFFHLVHGVQGVTLRNTGAGDFTDYHDGSDNTLNLGADGTVSTWPADMAVGDVLEDDSNVFGVVLTVDGTGHKVTLDTTLTPGPVTRFRGYPVVMEPSTRDAGKPGSDKRPTLGSWLFRGASFNSATAEYRSDVVPTWQASGVLKGTAGLTQPVQDGVLVTAIAPIQGARIHPRLTVNNALGYFQWQGFVLGFEELQQAIRR